MRNVRKTSRGGSVGDKIHQPGPGKRQSSEHRCRCAKARLMSYKSGSGFDAVWPPRRPVFPATSCGCGLTGFSGTRRQPERQMSVLA